MVSVWIPNSRGGGGRWEGEEERFQSSDIESCGCRTRKTDNQPLLKFYKWRQRLLGFGKFYAMFRGLSYAGSPTERFRSALRSYFDGWKLSFGFFPDAAMHLPVASHNILTTSTAGWSIWSVTDSSLTVSQPYRDEAPRIT
jgi:hypothetical protein